MIDPYHPIMGFTAWVLRENSAEKHSGGTDEVNARMAVPAAQSDRRSKRSGPSQRQRRGGDKTKNRRHRENREIFHESHGSWYRHRQLECRGLSRAVRSKFQERRLAGAETSPKSPRSHFNWRFFLVANLPVCEVQTHGHQEDAVAARAQSMMARGVLK